MTGIMVPISESLCRESRVGPDFGLAVAMAISGFVLFVDDALSVLKGGTLFVVVDVETVVAVVREVESPVKFR